MKKSRYNFRIYREVPRVSLFLGDDGYIDNIFFQVKDKKSIRY